MNHGQRIAYTGIVVEMRRLLQEMASVDPHEICADLYSQYTSRFNAGFVLLAAIEHDERNEVQA